MSFFPPFKVLFICLFIIFIKFLKDFIYLFDGERETASERGNTSRGSGRGRSRLPAEEPDAGLDPRTPGSRPEPKADFTTAPPRRPQISNSFKKM